MNRKENYICEFPSVCYFVNSWFVVTTAEHHDEGVEDGVPDLLFSSYEIILTIPHPPDRSYL
jgi:hypothetical protein